MEDVSVCWNSDNLELIVENEVSWEGRFILKKQPAIPTVK